MKALKITYSRLISKGNYENAKIEIELEVEPGEKAADVFQAAKAFVDKRIAIEKPNESELLKAQKILLDRRNYTIAQVEEAEEFIKKHELVEDLPF